MVVLFVIVLLTRFCLSYRKKNVNKKLGWLSWDFTLVFLVWFLSLGIDSELGYKYVELPNITCEDDSVT